MKTTVEFKGVILEVDFDYEEETPQTYDYPGDPAIVFIYDIKHKGVDFNGLLENYIEELENQILEEIEK